MNDELAIVIPVFNEGKNFPQFWQAVTAHVKSPFRAYVIYDFDEDDTVPVAKQVIDRGETRLELLKNNVKRGVVGAIQTGFNRVAAGPCLVVMADLSDDFSQVDDMLSLYNEGNQIVAGSRYMPGGKIIGAPFLKQMMSRLAGVSLHWLRG